MTDLLYASWVGTRVPLVVPKMMVVSCLQPQLGGPYALDEQAP